MWVKLGDTRVEEARFRALTRSTRLFYIELLSWSNKAGADGFIPTLTVRTISDHPDPMATLAELMEAGAVSVVLFRGYQLEWWLEDQMTAEQVERRRKANAERQARDRHRKWLHGQGDHTECGRWCDQRNGVAGQGNGVAVPGGRARRDQRNAPPSRPDPSPPTGGGRDEGAVPPPQRLTALRHRRRLRSSWPASDSSSNG
jgi:hypothetical protein